MVSFPQDSPPKSCITLYYTPYALHAPPISFFSILSPEQYWVRCKDYYYYYHPTTLTVTRTHTKYQAMARTCEWVYLLLLLLLDEEEET
jgi:hypothetical protein